MDKLFHLAPHSTASDTTLAYLAGFFDGEGSVTVARVRRSIGDASYYLAISITQTSLPVLQLYQMCFGPAIYSVKRPVGMAPTWVWRARQAKKGLFLSSLLPFVILKKSQFELALHFLEAYRLSSSGPPYRLSQVARDMGEKYVVEFSKLNQNAFNTRGGGRRPGLIGGNHGVTTR